MLKKEEPKHIKDILRKLTKSWGIETKYIEAQINSQWSKFVGTPIAKQTTKLYIKEKKLFVYLRSPIAKRELNILKPAVTMMINKRIGGTIITDIIIL